MPIYNLAITKDPLNDSSNLTIYLGSWCLDVINSEATEIEKLGICINSNNTTPLSNLDDHIWGLMDRFQAKLGSALNEIHGINEDLKYWQTITGPWVFVYINQVIALYRRIQEAFAKYDIATVSVRNFDYYKKLRPKTLDDFMFFTSSQGWNAMVTTEIIDHLVGQGEIKRNVNIRHVASATELIILNIPKDKYIPTIKDKIRIFLENVMNAIPARRNQPFIIASFLPNTHEALLKISFGASPKVFKSPDIPDIFASQGLRQQLQELMAENSVANLDKFLFGFISNCLPTIYLEGFDVINRITKKLDWPERPSFIFTSNNYYWDEIFKFWVAEKRKFGVPYFIGQHGNTYGTHKFTEKCPDINIPDKFITWGWARNSSRDIPAFVFKTSNRKRVVRKNKDSALLVLSTNDFRVPIISTYVETSNVRLRVLGDFYKKINTKYNQCLTIRIMHDKTEYLSGEEKYWRTIDPNVKLELGKIAIKRLVKNFNFIIYGYDSSGVLESLSEGRPTMMIILPEDLELLHDDVKKDYLKLMPCGILHLTSDSAADHFNKIFDQVDRWWKSKDVQDACNEFCNKYAKFIDSPVLTLRRILATASKEIKAREAKKNE
jgi:putative transferase (TIGR04331 family)